MRMRKEYDMSNSARGAVVHGLGKQRITIMLDSDILAAFRERGPPGLDAAIRL